MKKTPTIVLTGGGSGGHIMPLLSLAHALKRASKDCRVVYVGLKGESLAAELKDRFEIFDETYSVPAGKFRRYHGESLLAHLADIKTLALNCRDLFRVLAGVGYSLKLLRRLKPDVVFSKGGYVAVPVGLAAAVYRVPLVTHDSDTVPGLANRIIGRFAAIHATGMPAGHYDYPKASVRYVGIPVDERIKPVDGKLQASLKRQLGLPADCLLLLVGGAGLGARNVNDKVVAIAPELLKRFDDLRLIHVAGVQHQQSVGRAYKAALGSSADRVEVLGFTPEFYKYTGAADLVVTRAGATTIAELAVQKKAAVLIPAPQLTRGHQLKNADELAAGKAALVVADGALPEALAVAVGQTLESQASRRQLADKLGEFAKPDAAEQLATLLLQAAESDV